MEPEVTSDRGREANAQRKKSAGTGRYEDSKTLVAEIGERTAKTPK